MTDDKTMSAKEKARHVASTWINNLSDEVPEPDREQLEHFVTLALREHAAEAVEAERAKLDEWYGEVRYVRWDVHERAVEQEREACARIADQEAVTIGDDGYEGEIWVATKIAVAIRQRTEGGDSDG